MKIKYKNFVIEEDTYCYVLSEYGVKEKGNNIGEEYIKEQSYPATFKRALELVIKKTRAKKQEALELNKYIEEFNKSNKKFLSELRKIIGEKQEKR